MSNRESAHEIKFDKTIGVNAVYGIRHVTEGFTGSRSLPCGCIERWENEGGAVLVETPTWAGT